MLANHVWWARPPTCTAAVTLSWCFLAFQPAGHSVVGEMSVYHSLTFLFPACLKHVEGTTSPPPTPLPVFSWDNIFPFKHQLKSRPATYHKVWAGCPKVFSVIVFLPFPWGQKCYTQHMPVDLKLFTCSVGEVIATHWNVLPQQTVLASYYNGQLSVSWCFGGFIRAASYLLTVVDMIMTSFGRDYKSATFKKNKKE